MRGNFLAEKVIPEERNRALDSHTESYIGIDNLGGKE